MLPWWRMLSRLDLIIDTIDKKVLKIERKLYQYWLRASSNRRPSSTPYLSGDSFRALANHRHEEGQDIDPTAVQRGDVVYVSQGQLPDFFARMHPRITHQYVLMCHNGDRPQIDATITALLDEKIVRFFAQDVIEEHPKVTPIPIGLENKHLYAAGITRVFDRLRRRLGNGATPRKNRIFFNFSVHTNPAERGPAREYFLKHPLMETPPRFLSPRRHSRLLMQYTFVASPPGNAIESCRTWEALYLHTIPILKDYASFRFFASIGLPVWIVKDWSDLEHLTEAELSERYDAYIKNANWEPLFMNYWIARIDEAKAACTY
jgi:hypothetical protein